MCYPRTLLQVVLLSERGEIIMYIYTREDNNENKTHVHKTQLHY